MAFMHSVILAECLLCLLCPQTVSRWEDPDMVSLCMRLWKPCKDTWGTESLLTAPGNSVPHKMPHSILQTRALFPAWWGLDLGLREEAHLTSSPTPYSPPREPCTSGIISLVVTCLTGRLRGFNEIMFIKLFELLRRMNGAI